MYKIEGPEDGGKAPNGPNFVLIVALSLGAILVCFGIALLVTGRAGRLIHPVRPDPHPTSRLVMEPMDRAVG
ncbi:MAG TPA: hypothetical protein VGU46_06505 [Acidobacteriaceae bacterium]|nr:hypothetical protein [Acidobacteriaceae bacterium]